MKTSQWSVAAVRGEGRSRGGRRHARSGTKQIVERESTRTGKGQSHGTSGKSCAEADGDVPYDHTSILATLQDWLKIPEDKRLASNRVKNAPKIGDVLTRSTPRTDLPAIAVSGTFAKPTTRLIAVNDLQVAILEAHTKPYLHNLANPLKLRKLRTPPPKSKSR
jgi:hypothetical protein